jgi:uncharacterized membrane protein YhaH (DUF805 family)
MMKFIQCYASKFCTFSGRANRAEFWLFLLSFGVIQIILYYINKALGLEHIPFSLTGTYQAGSTMGSAGETIYLGYPLVLFLVYCLIPSIAVTVRRLHDRDMSGWMLLLNVIPLIGGIILLVFYLLPGTPGPNRFDSTERRTSE